MGTNYYLRIIPSKRRQQTLKQAITDNDFSLVGKLHREIYDTIPEYPDKEDLKHFGYLHLGKRSGGWKFLWSPNIYDFYDEVIQLYDLSKEGIYKYLKSFKDAYVVDEYNLNNPPQLSIIQKDNKDDTYDKLGQWSIDGFMKMALDWNKDKTVDNQYESPYYYPNSPTWKDYIIGKYPKAIFIHGDVWIDNMRFATTNDFS